MSETGSAGNVIAAICTVFIPGLGQLVQARILPALFFFVTVSILYALGPWTLFITFIPGALIHLWAIVSAATFKG